MTSSRPPWFELRTAATNAKRASKRRGESLHSPPSPCPFPARALSSRINIVFRAVEGIPTHRQTDTTSPARLTLVLRDARRSRACFPRCLDSPAVPATTPDPTAQRPAPRAGRSNTFTLLPECPAPLRPELGQCTSSLSAESLSRRPCCVWIHPVVSTAADTHCVKPSSSYSPPPCPSPPDPAPQLQSSRHA